MQDMHAIHTARIVRRISYWVPGGVAFPQRVCGDHCECAVAVGAACGYCRGSRVGWTNQCETGDGQGPRVVLGQPKG